MRPVFALGLCLLYAFPAAAQVSVDTGALDALGGSAQQNSSQHNAAGRSTAGHGAGKQGTAAQGGSAAAATRRHGRTGRGHPSAHATPARHQTSHPGASHPARAVRQALPTVPAAPPAAATLPPPLVVTPAHPAPPPPVPVLANAAGTASDFGTGKRITFGAGAADLNPTTAAAIASMAAAAKADPALRLDVDAYAPGTADDPSTPRRLSLSRALAARAVLIHEGVPSDHIYVRALGNTAGFAAGPPDRVDITRALPNGAPLPVPAATHAAVPAAGAPHRAPGKPGPT